MFQVPDDAFTCTDSLAVLHPDTASVRVAYTGTIESFSNGRKELEFFAEGSVIPESVRAWVHTPAAASAQHQTTVRIVDEHAVWLPISITGSFESRKFVDATLDNSGRFSVTFKNTDGSETHQSQVVQYSTKRTRQYRVEIVLAKPLPTAPTAEVELELHYALRCATEVFYTVDLYERTVKLTLAVRYPEERPLETRLAYSEHGPSYGHERQSEFADAERSEAPRSLKQMVTNSSPEEVEQLLSLESHDLGDGPLSRSLLNRPTKRLAAIALGYEIFLPIPARVLDTEKLRPTPVLSLPLSVVPVQGKVQVYGSEDYTYFTEGYFQRGAEPDSQTARLKPYSDAVRVSYQLDMKLEKTVLHVTINVDNTSRAVVPYLVVSFPSSFWLNQTQYVFGLTSPNFKYTNLEPGSTTKTVSLTFSEIKRE